jgi:hypothetical protein
MDILPDSTYITTLRNAFHKNIQKLSPVIATLKRPRVTIYLGLFTPATDPEDHYPSRAMRIEQNFPHFLSLEELNS